MRTFFLLALPLAMLSACGTTGIQYQSASESEPHARFEKWEQDIWRSKAIQILNFDQEGCAKGRTDVTGDTRLRVGEEAVIKARDHLDYGTCSIVFGMTPQADTTYGMRFYGDRTVCRVRVVRIEADGKESPTPIRALQEVGSWREFGCLRVAPKPEP